MDRTTFLETPRLLARSFVRNDARAFVAYRADPEVARFQSWSDHTLDLGTALIDAVQEARPGVPGRWHQFSLESEWAGRG